jgi:hypothetical protein
VMPLVAAKKPSGRSDCSKVADMRRNRSLILVEEAALGRLVTEPRRVSALGDSGGTLASSSREGNGSVLSGADVILAQLRLTQGRGKQDSKVAPELMQTR